MSAQAQVPSKADSARSAVELGQQLRLERDALGWSRSELARQAGVSARSVRVAEDGRSLNLELLERIAEAMDLVLEARLVFAGERRRLHREADQLARQWLGLDEPLRTTVREAVASLDELQTERTKAG